MWQEYCDTQQKSDFYGDYKEIHWDMCEIP